MTPASVAENSAWNLQPISINSDIFKALGLGAKSEQTEVHVKVTILFFFGYMIIILLTDY